MKDELILMALHQKSFRYFTSNVFGLISTIVLYIFESEIIIKESLCEQEVV